MSDNSVKPTQEDMFDANKTQMFAGTVVDGNTKNMSDAKIYKRKGHVIVNMLQIPITFYHDWGKQDMMPGDFQITDPGNEDTKTRTWGCEAATFMKTYQPVAGKPGYYQKTARIRAIQMDSNFIVTSLDSKQAEVARKDDWLVENIRIDDVHDRYFIEEYHFNELYEEDLDYVILGTAE